MFTTWQRADKGSTELNVIFNIPKRGRDRREGRDTTTLKKTLNKYLTSVSF